MIVLFLLPVAISAATNVSPCQIKNVRTLDLGNNIKAVEVLKVCGQYDFIVTSENELFVCSAKTVSPDCVIVARFGAVGITGAPITKKQNTLVLHLRAGYQIQTFSSHAAKIKLKVAYDDTTMRYLRDENLMGPPMKIDPVDRD